MGTRETETVAVTMRLPKELLGEFDAFAEEIGANRKSLVQMFMKRCVDERRLPFGSLEPVSRTKARDDLRAAVKSVLEEKDQKEGFPDRAVFEEDTVE